MVKGKINLFELRSNPYGLVISPMLASFVIHEDREKAFSPHRHDSYGLFFLRSGELAMLVDDKEVHMRGCSMLFVRPGQVHQCLHSKEICGWVMFFDGKNVDVKARAALEQSTEKISFFNLPGHELLFCDQLLHAIFEGLHAQQPGSFQTQKLHALINALFYHTTDMQLSLKSIDRSTSRSGQIVQQFQDLIKMNFKEIKQPSAYAALLHISLSHLNDTVKALTGYSATHLLQEEIIGEAQRQLMYTNKTGKEIAFDLGYTDHKYFIRLFSKVAGHSPSNFRKAKGHSRKPTARMDKINL